MTARTLLLILCLGLAGCEKTLTNDEIIKETKKCKDAGMRAQVVYDGWTFSVHKIVCWPVEEEEKK